MKSDDEQDQDDSTLMALANFVERQKQRNGATNKAGYKKAYGNNGSANKGTWKSGNNQGQEIIRTILDRHPNLKEVDISSRRARVVRIIKGMAANPRVTETEMASTQEGMLIDLKRKRAV